jgi:hypothetical protein
MYEHFEIETEEDKRTRHMQAMAQAALESAEASKTLARIAEQGQASARLSTWMAVISCIAAFAAAAVSVIQYSFQFKPG